VAAGDSNTQTITFRLEQAPPPRMLAVPRQEVEGGRPTTVDLEPYLVPGVANPSVRVESVRQIGGPAISSRTDGTRVTFSSGKQVHGRATFAVVMTDLAGAGSPTRRAEGTIEVTAVGVPDAPDFPIEWDRGEDSEKLMLFWNRPKDGGSPILRYELQEVYSKKVQRCPGTQCQYYAAKPGVDYKFRVRAVNRVGPSEWSGPSKEATVETKMLPVRNLRVVGRGDGTVTLAWNRPDTPDEVRGYRINGSGTMLSSTRYTHHTQSNDRVETVSVVAVGFHSPSVPVEIQVQSIGTPAAPGAPTLSAGSSSSTATSANISWGAVSPNGPGPTQYSVQVRKDGGQWTDLAACVGITATACTHGGLRLDGSRYAYRLRANNRGESGAGRFSPWSSSATFEAVGTPASWGAWTIRPTGRNQQAEITYTVPESRGANAVVHAQVEGGARERVPGGTGTQTATVSVPSNDQSYRVTLEVCNEHGNCTSSNPQPVQTYGNLSGAVQDSSLEVSGKAMRWSVRAGGNGDPATLNYRILEGGAVRDSGSMPVGVAADWHSIPAYTASDWKVDVRLEVEVVDTAPADRGTGSLRRTDESGVPDPPSVTVGIGAACSDAEGSGTPCNVEGGYQGLPCTADNCHRITIGVSGFVTDYTCTLNKPVYQHWTNEVTVVNPRNGFYFHGGVAPGKVELRCWTRIQEATSVIDWPRRNNQATQ